MSEAESAEVKEDAQEPAKEADKTETAEEAPKEGDTAPQEAVVQAEAASATPTEGADSQQQGEDGAPKEDAEAQLKQVDDTVSDQRGDSKTMHVSVQPSQQMIRKDSKTSGSASPRRRSSSRRSSQEERRSQRLSRSGVITTLGIGKRVSGDQYGVFDKQKPKFMNTYRLESQKPFHVESVLKIITEILDRELQDVEYEPESNMKLAALMAGEIRGRVKMLGFERYKIIAAVTIGEKRLQDIYMICKFLWDCERDMHAIWSFENTHIYAVAFVFGLYYE